MKKLEKIYYYLFYKIYKSIEYTSEFGGGKFLTSFKAGLVMIALEIWILMSLGAYYAVYTKTAIELSLSMPIVYIPLVIIILFNYFTLDYMNQWKKYIEKFNQLPKKQNRIGGWLVFGFMLFVIANLIFSFYLMSQIDWSQYR